ncbi:MAG TPA: RNA polymerase sigma factor [Solirubrobacteraceae bacterium]
MARLDPHSLPRHVDRLYRAAWALCGSPHDAEDLVQETFARVLARPRMLRGQDELAYLMQVLRNTFLTQRRTAARRPQTASVALEDIEAADPRSAERPEQALAAREVFGVIAALPENYRLAVVAVDVLGLSYREAAKALGTREATIATRVFRGRERVAQKLAGEAEGHAAGPTGHAAEHTGEAAEHTGHAAVPTSDAAEHTGHAAEHTGDAAVPREASGPQGSLV